MRSGADTGELSIVTCHIFLEGRLLLRSLDLENRIRGRMMRRKTQVLVLTAVTVEYAGQRNHVPWEQGWLPMANGAAMSAYINTTVRISIPEALLLL